jgi:nitrogen fixation protein FixH
LDKTTADACRPEISERTVSAQVGLNLTSSAPRSAWFWPALVISLLAGQVVLVLVMAYLAVSDHSFAVEPDYYRKALHWDAEMAQQQANRRLGWSLHVEISEPSDLFQQRGVRCVIADRAGKPVEGATVELVAFPHVRGNERQTLTLAAVEAGRYGAAVRMAQGGLWEFRVVAKRGAELATHMELVQVRVPGAVVR